MPPIGYFVSVGFGLAAGYAAYQLTKNENATDAIVDGAMPDTLQEEKKKKKPYAPNRPLPLDERGRHVPDTDAPHTQLGTRDGENGKYPQAREFDGNGKAVRDADFTDHGRPDKHPNPHQHRWKENPTGGSKIRDDPEPLEGWQY